MKLLPYEVWRDIKGYEGLYQISARGMVKSVGRTIIDKNGVSKWSRKLILRPGNTKTGYRFVRLYNGTESKCIKVHRLVANSFIMNSKMKAEINHIDGNKSNNNASNLEWCTHRENMIHSVKNGLQGELSKETREKMSKRCIAQFSKKVIDTVSGKIYNSAKDAAKINNIDHASLMRMLSGRQQNITQFEYAIR